MNDSLALEVQAEARAVGQSSPTRRIMAPVLPARRQSQQPARVDGAMICPSLPASIESRLRLGAARLFERSDAATQARFVDLVSKRLGAMISDAVALFGAQVGALAAQIEQGERAKLQDLALTVRIGSEDLLTRAAAVLSPSQLVAILASVCEAHAPGSLDCLRCREAVYGGTDRLAREAMLDLVSPESDPATDSLRRAVATHMIELFEQRSSLTRDTVARLRASAHRNTEPGAHETETGARARLDGGLSVQDTLAQAIRHGQTATATALLASAAGVSRATVQAALCLRTAKGLVSLAWRAGLDWPFAAIIQSTLGRLPPDQVLHPTEAGGYPMTEPEMLWQCRFLARSQHAFTN